MVNIENQKLSLDHLSLLYRLSQTVNSSLDLDEVLNKVMDEVVAALKAERGFIMLQDKGDELVFCTARGIDKNTIEEPGFQVSRGVVDKVAQSGQPVLTSDALQDDRLSMRESVVALGLRSLLCVPLQVKGDTIGVIYVDNRFQIGIFTQEDMELLKAIAVNAAIAIENARLYQVAVEKGRMEKELQLAYKVQSSLLPTEIPTAEGWDFAAKWQPANQVAGDFYDFIYQDQGNIGLVIADVTDKGMPAALYMALSRSILRSSVNHSHTPVEAIADSNRLICSESTYGFFVTLVYMLLNPFSSQVTYVNAGHIPPFLFRSQSSIADGHLLRLMPTGIPLGIDEERTYEQKTVTLNSGDFIFLYTDGVTEAIDYHEREFGAERLQKILASVADKSAREIITVIENELKGFIGAQEPFDDVTIVVVKKN